MMTSIPYEDATSSKFGCQSFGHMVDAERGLTVVQFRWRDRHIQLEASWKGMLLRSEQKVVEFKP